MTLHFHWLRAPRWLANVHASRAVSLVLGVIGVSLLFSALRVLDTAFSGALIAPRAFAVAPAAPAASGTADVLLRTDPTASGATAVDTSLGEVPEAAVEAVSL